MATLIRDVRIFDGVKVVDADTVLIAGDRIAEVGTRLDAPQGSEVVSGAGGTLMPGLIDAHSHTSMGSLDQGILGLRQALLLGVTTSLCMGSDPGVIARLKALRRSDIADIRSAGVVATVAGSHPTQWFPDYPVLTTVADVASFMRQRIAEGSDYLKLIIEDSSAIGKSTPFMPPELSAAVTAEAHARGLIVVCHAQCRRFVEQAIESGIDGLAHQYVDQPITAEFARFIKESGVFVVMTLAVYHTVEGAGIADDPHLRPYLTAESRESLRQSVSGQEQFQRYALGAVRPLAEAGVPILAGSDVSGPGTAHGATLHHELELLVRGGLATTRALAAATSLPAQHFRLHNRGRIQSGMRADLLLVNGDPTTNILATRAIERIWRQGHPVDRQRLLVGRSAK